MAKERKDKLKTPKITKDTQESTTHKVTTGCGRMYITVCKDNGQVSDILISMGKSGGCAQAQVGCISALLSSSIKSGVDPNVLINDLIGVRCNQPLYQFGEDVLSCGDAIGKFLKYYFDNNLYSDQQEEPENEPDKSELSKVE